MRRTTLSVLSSLAILLSGMIVPEAAAQSRRDKEQTYVLEKPYEVKKLVPPTGKKIKNVILMIGDGMSLMHMYSAWTANRGKLWLDNSQYTGLSKTYCANRLITDSGAGGTALATGHKTNYHMVGVDPAGKPLESLATLANKKGLSSGIAVTCRLWDATPADFCCHNTDRDAEAEIVASLCRNLLAQSVQFTLCWNENSQLVRHLVRDLDELIALLPRLLTAKAEPGLSGAQLLLQTTPAGAYSHLIYVSGEQPAGPNLQTLGHLTALVCGADYSETDYMNQLSELTI
mgnify:CR=1 FL=1